MYGYKELKTMAAARSSNSIILSLSSLDPRDRKVGKEVPKTAYQTMY